MSASDFNDSVVGNGIQIFSVTDHNYFSKKFYDELQEDIIARALKLSLIPGTEFDCYIDMNPEKYFHCCIYFQTNVDFSKLEKTVNELYQKNDGTPLYPTIFDILDKLSELKCKFIVIPHGDKSAGLFNLIRDSEIINEDDFYKYAMYKIFNGFDVKPGFYRTSLEHWDADFFEHSKECSDIMDSYSEETLPELENSIRDKIRDKTKTLNENEQKVFDYINNYGHFYAYFSFSDWHNKEPYILPINNFIYGSLDLPFESFELATLDPVSRVQITHENIIEIPDSLISSVSFTLGEKEHSVSFSPGLNAVVGKRGTGKSLLLSVIRNLVDANDGDGVLKIYSKLNPGNIKVKDMKGIETGLGSLGSVVFLSQDRISDIFKDPNKATEGIKEYFPASPSINLDYLLSIKDILKKITPYNTNYKNLTNYIANLKEFKEYSFSKYSLFDDPNFKNKCTSFSTDAEQIRNQFASNSMDMTFFDKKFKEFKSAINLYWKMYSKYDNLVVNLNQKIESINSQQSVNQQISKNNITTLNEAIKNLVSDFDKQLNFQKLKYLLENFNFEDPQVSVNIKNKYLFASYFEIPEDFSEQVKNSIFDSFAYSGHEIKDVEKYLNGDIDLKKSSPNIYSNFGKFLESDLFKSKFTFYEIKDEKLDYKTKITNFKELMMCCNSNALVDLNKVSLGMQSVVYLDLLFSLDGNILVLDQPEDNIDNDYISSYLVPNIKKSKKVKQMIFVTHNPSIAVYGDAFNYIYVTNDGEIKYENYYIEKVEDKEKLLKILDGGRQSFSNRNKKYGYILGENTYEN